jgi:hypothetical protein
VAKILKLFRDKEAWNQHEASLASAKEKFEAEEEYRKKLAVEVGLEEGEVERSFNHHIDAKLFYPEFDRDSPEYPIWRNGCTEQESIDITEENLKKANRTCGWPTEVLEELALFQKYNIFETWGGFYSRGGAEEYRSRFLYGIRGRNRYFVAWWGEKEVYDQIQEKLRELREPKPIGHQPPEPWPDPKPAGSPVVSEPKKPFIMWHEDITKWRLREAMVAIFSTPVILLITVVLPAWLWGAFDDPPETHSTPVIETISKPERKEY